MPFCMSSLHELLVKLFDPLIAMRERPLRTKLVTHERHRHLMQFKREGQPSRLFAARGLPSMCDYSLHNVASRPAKVRDKLVTSSISSREGLLPSENRMWRCAFFPAPK